MDKDLYQILGVKKDAGEAEIRKAFLKLAKKYHPDVNAGDKASETKFKEINFAYEVLKDAKKRAQYDQMQAMGANPYARAGATAGGWHGGGGRPMGPEAFAEFGLGDLFEEIFGSGGFGGMPGARTGRGSSRSFSQKGADRQADITVSLMEAAQGVERSLEFSDGRRLKVKIPIGVAEGSKIKLSGQGEPGIGNAPSGDLILTLHVAPHPYFQREGNDILLKLPVTFSESVLGVEVEVPTLDGKVHLKLPKGVSSGQRLKIAGKGIRSAQGDKKGDQYVEIQIKVPKNPDLAYVESAQKLQGTVFNPRQDLF